MKPQFRAEGLLVEALATSLDIPVSHQASSSLPVVRLRWLGPFDVEGESGYVFGRGLVLVSNDVVIGRIEQPISVGTLLRFRDEVPSEILDQRNHMRRLFPLPRATWFAAHPDRILDCYMHDFDGDHEFSPSPFEIYPPLGSTRPVVGAAYIHTKLDEPSYLRMLAEYTHPTDPSPSDPYLEVLREFTLGARASILEPGKRFARRSARFDHALTVLRNAIDLVEDLRPEDFVLAALPSRTGRTQLSPSVLSSSAVQWHSDLDPNAQVAYLTFALTDDQAYYVPTGVVGEIFRARDPLELPRAWAWQGGLFRFVNVYFVRRHDGADEEIALMCHLYGYDAARGAMVDVPLDGQWHGELLRSALDKMGLEASDRDFFVGELRSVSVVRDYAGPESPRDTYWMPAVRRARSIPVKRNRPRDLVREGEMVVERYPHLDGLRGAWLNPFRLATGPCFALENVRTCGYDDREVCVLALPLDLPGSTDLRDVILENSPRTLLYLAEGVAVDDVTWRHPAVWLFQFGRSVALEHGFVDVSHGLVIRMEGCTVGDVRPQTEVGRSHLHADRIFYGRLLPEHLAQADLHLVFERPRPTYLDRGRPVSSAIPVSQAALREVVEYSGGSKREAARLLPVWGLTRMSDSTLRTHLAASEGVDLRRVPSGIADSVDMPSS